MRRRMRASDGFSYELTESEFDKIMTYYRNMGKAVVTEQELAEAFRSGVHLRAQDTSGVKFNREYLQEIADAGIPTEDELNDSVNRPAHYTSGKIELTDFIIDQELDFCSGNVVKYVVRAGKKDPAKEIEDLKKAQWYLARKIKELESDD